MRFLAAAAGELPARSRVLDAGAGQAPYRELFRHCDYTTLDWELSPHSAARHADVVAPLDRIPLVDRSFDAVISTQVLEHVPRPAEVLDELFRVLRPAGELFLTAPLVWSLHEEPYDFYRFTRYGLEELLRSAGFTDVHVKPHCGYFATLAQLLRGYGSAVHGDTSPDRPRSRFLAAILWRISGLVARLDGLDQRRSLTLGYACRARRPPGPS